MVAEEFWAQGDLEQGMTSPTSSTPGPLPPMLDRQRSLAETQIEFLDNVCAGVYGDLAKFHPGLAVLAEGVSRNRKCWAEGGCESREEGEEVAIDQGVVGAKVQTRNL